MTNRISSLREQLLCEYAEIMLEALKGAGVIFTPDEYDRAREKLMNAISGITTV